MKCKVNVLKNFDGFTATECVQVERVLIKRTPLEENSFFLASYKGKLYKTFTLPGSYGTLSGRCISVK